jgi:hypothetical protein
MSKSARRRRREARAKKIKRQPDSVEAAAGEQTTKADRRQTNQERTLRAVWRKQPTKLILTVLLSLAVAIYVGRPVAHQQGLGQAVVWGAIAGASIWVAVYASYRLNRWLRRR